MSPDDNEILGVSTHIRHIHNLIAQNAESKNPVLIIGPTGTGKELIARNLHQQSGRQGKFVPVNCAAISRDLIASQLFGHEKGAFTGATTKKIGVFDEAKNGTLFLDEIGKLPKDEQGALLRVLQEEEMMPVGGKVKKTENVRVIAAMKDEERDELGDDLYYRLSKIEFKTLPLNERREDIVVLTNHYSRNKRVDPSVKAFIYSSELPGNVREIQNYIGRNYESINSPLSKDMKKEIEDGLILDIENWVQTYEIFILRSAGLNRYDIAKHIRMRRECLTDEWWKDHYGITLDDYIRRCNKEDNQLLYPDFTNHGYFVLAGKAAFRSFN